MFDPRRCELMKLVAEYRITEAELDGMKEFSRLLCSFELNEQEQALARGNPIAAIKSLRARFLGKEIVDAWRDKNPVTP